MNYTNKLNTQRYYSHKHVPLCNTHCFISCKSHIKQSC